jgi:hypothetical protein
MPFGTPPAFRLEVHVEKPLALDQASMGPVRLVRISGGSVTGGIKGRIVRGGTDWQTVTPGGVIAIEARYLLELEDGAVVELQSRGQRTADARYFWTPIWLRTTVPALDDLNRHQYLGYGVKTPDAVVIDVFQLP